MADNENIWSQIFENSDSEADFDGFGEEDLVQEVNLPEYDALDIDGDEDLPVDLNLGWKKGDRSTACHSVHR